jgi:hypothetical protein
MPTAKQIKQAFVDCLARLDNKPFVRMYWVTDSKERGRKFELYKIDLRGTTPEHFREPLREKVATLYSINNDHFKDFDDPHRRISDILYIESEQVENFDEILKDIDQSSDVSPPPSTDKMGKFWGIAIEVQFRNSKGEDEKVVYFTKYTLNKVIGKTNEDGEWTGKLSKEGKLDEIPGTAVTFDKNIDFIYFRQLNSVVITPPHINFEMMFEMRGYYQKEARSSLERLVAKNLIVIASDSIVEDASNSTALSKTLTKLSKHFFAKIESGEVEIFFFEESKRQVGAIISYEIVEGKIHIKDIEALRAFADVCSHKYLKSMAGYKENTDPLVFVTDYRHIFDKARSMS